MDLVTMLTDYNLSKPAVKSLLELIYSQQITDNKTPEQQHICGNIKIIYDAILICMNGFTTQAIQKSRECIALPSIVYQSFSRRLALEYVFAMSSDSPRNRLTYENNCMWVHADQDLNISPNRKHIIYIMSFIDIINR